VGTAAGAVLISLFSAPSSADTYRVLIRQPLLAFLGWLGALVIVFAAKNLILRRWPEAFGWRPRPVPDPDRAGRVANTALALLWAALLVLYLAPGPIAHALSLGAVDAGTLAYSDSFAGPLRMPWLVPLLVTAAALHLLVAAQGRWRRGTRWARTALTAAIGSQLGWHASYGSVFADSGTDRDLLPVLGAASAALLIAAALQLYRSYTRVRPAPAT
jgi:hypothetical protein